MGVQKITFDGANITAKMDADLYHFFFSKEVGILENIKQECVYSLSNNTITFQDGYIAIYGRIIYLENQTAVSINPDSSKFGYVILGVDTSTNLVSVYSKEAVGNYPDLIYTNLHTTEGLFEFPLCAYTKTTTSVTLIPNYQRMMITSDSDKISDLDNSIRNNYSPRLVTPNKISNGVYSFDNTGSAQLSDSILYVVIEYSVVVTFPGQLIFLVIGSNTSVGYQYAGSNYSLGVTYGNGIVTLSCGNSTHRVTSVILKK